MREVVEYCTLVEFCRSNIDGAVNDKLLKGWELFGQPSFAVTRWKDRIQWTEGNDKYASRFCFTQTMVRYKKEDSK